jgi:hypothetical protein
MPGITVPRIIQSNGGPLLMLERALLPYWGGMDNIGGVRPQSVHGGPLTDYDRACNIRDWIAPLKVLNGTGIVFWGDDLGLGLERESDTVFFAVRIYYVIDNLEDHIDSARENPNCFKKDFDIFLSSSKVTVFDSVATGFEVRRSYLEIDIVPGLYEVLTYEQKTPDAEIVFHKFQLRRGMLHRMQLSDNDSQSQDINRGERRSTVRPCTSAELLLHRLHPVK